MIKLIRAVMVCVACAYGAVAVAGIVASAPITVTQIYMYSEFGNGDVAFVGTGGAPGCDGFWLRPSDAGFKTLYAALLSAYTAKTSFSVVAYDNEIWSGSTTRFCRAYGLFPQ